MVGPVSPVVQPGVNAGDHGGSGTQLVHVGPIDTSSTIGGAPGSNPMNLQSTAQETGTASGPHQKFA
jgi:hypothetical protein